VRENSKQRFAMKLIPDQAAPESDSSRYLIRATQGHSLNIESAELLTPLTFETVPKEPVIHGGFYGSWDAILASGGLSRMNRKHMHFARADPGKKILSGFRYDAELLIGVDAAKAMEKGGIAFWESSNGVVLTEGNADGMLPLEFFATVVDRAGTLGIIFEDGRAVQDLPENLKSRKVPRGKEVKKPDGETRESKVKKPKKEKDKKNKKPATEGTVDLQSGEPPTGETVLVEALSNDNEIILPTRTKPISSKASIADES
jgi:2'-phosphotransferase